MTTAEYLAERRRIIDRALEENLPAAETQPASIHEAMRYAVLGGGKRIRPILAIAAAKLGYSPVAAFDFDPVAVSVARQNARKNRARLKILRADITRIVTSKKYDVVCANLTTDLLEGCARKLKAFLKPTGVLILAGILRTEFDSIRSRFEKLGFSVVVRRPEGEWESLALRGS